MRGRWLIDSMAACAGAGAGAQQQQRYCMACTAVHHHPPTHPTLLFTAEREKEPVVV